MLIFINLVYNIKSIYFLDFIKYPKLVVQAKINVIFPLLQKSLLRSQLIKFFYINSMS